MSFQSPVYFFWLPVVAAVYLHLPQKLQTAWLALTSLVFFAACTPPDLSAPDAAFRTLLPWGVLAFVTFLVWTVGRGIAAAGDSPRRGRLLRAGILTLLALLAVFKYYNLSPLPTLFWGTFAQTLPFPLGISFTTFAAIGYLVDLAHGDCEPARSPVELFVFLFFFGTITSGPICRAGKILPQLRAEHRFDADRTVRAGQLFALGLFKKVAVADVLGLVVNEVFAHLDGGYGAPMLLLALVMYTLQLYFDFCGYSEMARATGLALGLELPENFSTPFFATNFSGFWNRWHISLSSWLQDYVFTSLVWMDASRLPLIGRRRERLPVEWCLFAVFFVSGFWHGNTLPFAVWGLLQAVYRVGEELLHRRLGKPKKRGVPLRVVRAKRAVVFVLWTFSMLFFRVGSGPDTSSLADAGLFVRGLGRGWSGRLFAAQLSQAIQNGFYANSLMTAAYLIFVLFVLALAFWLDAERFQRCKGASAESVLNARKAPARWALYYLLVFCILAGLIIQNGGFGGGASFAYANF